MVSAVKPCPCECNSGGFCGGCGHAGCSGGINLPEKKKEEYLMSRLMEPDFLKAVTDFEEQQMLAQELMEKDPTLNHITAIIIAGDRRSAERAKKMMADGVPYKEAAVWVGSYSRVDLAVWARERGYVEDEDLFKILPELWRGSDPDDTDPRFLELWEDAWRWNDRKAIRDGKALPRKATLDIYRGQDPVKPGEVPGIAWSLDKNIAEKFARGAATRESHRAGVVLHARVNREDVIAYLTGRNEQEVIINPKLVQ